MKRTPFLVLFVLLIATACGPGTGGNPAQPTGTLLRYPTTQPAAIAIVQQQWFSEHFKDGMPGNWVASPGWSSGASSTRSTLPEQTFRVPAEWTDLVIHARLRHGPQGWSSIGFRDKDDNYYQVSYNEASLILGRHSSGQLHGEFLASREMVINAEWHDLVISAVGGRIKISWDGQTVIDYFDEDPLLSGDIFVQNWDNTLYELDILEVTQPEGVAVVPGGGGSSPTLPGGSTGPGDGQPVTISTDTPPGGGAPLTKSTDTPPGGAPPVIVPTDTPSSGGGVRTPVPGNPVVDLALGGGSFDGLQNLWVTISNNGPDAYTGTIKVSCTTWYTNTRTSETFGLTAEMNHSLALEPGQSQDVQAGCIKDEQLGPYIGSSINITSLPFDPNPVNNSLIIYP